MTRPHRRLITAFLLLLTTVLYLPTLDHDFHFDDIQKLVRNPRLRAPGTYFEAFFRKGYSEDTTRLIPNLTFCWDAAVSGALGAAAPAEGGAGRDRPAPLNPWWFNLTNLLVHLANVWLVARLGRAVMRRLGQPDSPIPLLAAGLFAVHTLNSEAVNYCNARPNTLATLFYLATLVNWLRVVEGAGRPASLRWRQGGVLAATFAAALLCKELAVTLVVTMPLLLYWLGGEPGGRYRALVARVGVAVAVVAAAGLGAVFLTGGYAGIGHRFAFEAGQEASFSPAAYFGINLLMQSRVLVAYFGLALLPLPRFLSADHGLQHLYRQLHPLEGPPADNAGALLGVAIACFAALAVGAVAAVLLRRRLPLATFFFLWPLVTHAPTSLVPRDEVMVEYRTYLPMAGLCILLAWAVVTGLEALARRAVWPPRRRWTALGAAALVLLAALGAGTWERNEVWRTRVSLWDDVASKMDPATTKPWSLYRAWQNLGMSCVDATPPRADDALAALGKAIAIDPARWEAYNNRSLLRFRLKEYDAALSDAREAIALGATDPSPYFSAADALIGRGDPAGALEALREGMARHPGDAMPPLKLAWVLQFKLGRSEEAREAVELAAALQPLALGRPGETASELEAFLLRHPGNTDGLFTLGVCRLKWTREPERGAEALRRAIERSPGSPSHREALRLLAEAAWAAGREEDGLKLFQDLASRFPEDYEVQIRLGYYYLDWKKDRPKAEMHLRRAIELRPRHAGSSAARKKLEGR